MGEDMSTGHMTHDVYATRDVYVWGTVYAALSWYNFREGAEIFETDGVLGDSKYDYILSYEPKKPSAELFAAFAERLKPGGRLLILLDNKFGIKYWCGARGGFFEKSFGEIEGGNTMLSAVQLSRELIKAGFISQKWYYPIPDHRFPKAVYSENKLPDPSFSTISPALQTDGAGVLLKESEILPSVIESGAFTFMCNSFIIEAALEPGAVMSSVDFAALTLYRPPNRAFITTVHSNGTAMKTAAHPEGVISLEKLVENHARLLKRGIETVPLSLEGNSVKMPAVHHETLWEHMQRETREGRFDRAEFIKIFDRLRDDILKSSAVYPPGTHGHDPQFGPVLEYAYTEMIPANCFYDKQRGAFIYFDQEHVIQNCPYSVPLSRALMSITYSPELAAHAGAKALFEELKVRYGLEKCFNRLVETERNFIADLVHGTKAAQDFKSASASASSEISENRRIHDMLTAARILMRKYKKIALYGNGKRGNIFSAVLAILENPPVFIADSKTGGLPKNTAADVIVVTPMHDAETIAAMLSHETNTPIVTLNELL